MWHTVLLYASFLKWNPDYAWKFGNHVLYIRKMANQTHMMTSSNGNNFPCNWPFWRGFHRPPVNSPHKGKWRRSLMFVIKWKIIRVIVPLWGKSTGPRWIPLTKASDAELWCFLIRAWTSSWASTQDAGNLRRHCAPHDVIIMRFRTHSHQRQP